MSNIVTAFLMKPGGIHNLISTANSIMSLRMMLGDDLMITKPFGTYAYAFNANAQENGEPFNRIIRLADNKVAKVYGDFIIVNTKLTTEHPRPIIVEFTNEDIGAIAAELGISPQEITDAREHEPHQHKGLISDIQQTYDGNYGLNKIRFSITGPSESNERRETLFAGSLVMANSEESLTNTSQYLRNHGLKIKGLPIVPDEECDLAVIHDVTTIGDTEESAAAASLLFEILQNELETACIFIPNDVLKEEHKPFWEGLCIPADIIEEHGILFDLKEEMDGHPDVLHNFLLTKRAETNLVQMAMDDPTLSWGAKGIIQYMFVVDFETSITELSNRSASGPKTIGIFINDLIDRSYIQEFQETKRASWAFDATLMKNIVNSLMVN